jgi:Txe/YoeB family toxin of Txe-Axe toxin-antitoxin module
MLLKCVKKIETVIELIKTNYFSIYHFFEKSF